MPGESQFRFQLAPWTHKDDLALKWHRALLKNPRALRYLTKTRGLSLDIIRRYQLGYTSQVPQGRGYSPWEGPSWTIPIPALTGRVGQIRIYHPDQQPKIKPLFTGLHNFLFPIDQLEAGEILITEGEFDALTAIHHGLAAITGTTGANSQWDQELVHLLTGKQVSVWYDNDTAGRRGATKRSLELHGIAAQVRVVPHPPERKPGADVNDWFVKEKRGIGAFRRQIEAAPLFDPWDFSTLPGWPEKVRKAAEVQELQQQGRILRAASRFTAPEWDPSLREELAASDGQHLDWAIKDWHAEGTNTMIPSLPGVGKTVLMQNYAACRADEKAMFLGQALADLPEDTRVGFLNLELTKRMFDVWMHKMDIEHPERIAVLHLRDQGLAITDDTARKWLLGWLRDQNIYDLIIDTRRAMMADCGLEEMNHGDAAAIVRLLDIDLKKASGCVRNVFMTCHTPRPIPRIGGDYVHERPLGPVSWDGWADNVWFYGKEGEARFLQLPKARSGELPEGWSVGLAFNRETNHLFLSGRDRQELKERHAKLEVQARAKEVVKWVKKHPDSSSNDIEDGVSGDNNIIRKARAWAVERKYLNVTLGQRNAHLHRVSEKGEEWLNG